MPDVKVSLLPPLGNGGDGRSGTAESNEQMSKTGSANNAMKLAVIEVLRYGR